MSENLLNQINHTFCKPCISNWLEKNQNKNCPLCNQQVKKTQNIEYSRDLIATAMVDDLHVYCLNYDECKWTGELQNLIGHLKTCKFEVQRIQNQSQKLLQEDKIKQENFIDINDDEVEEVSFISKQQKKKNGIKKKNRNSNRTKYRNLNSLEQNNVEQNQEQTQKKLKKQNEHMSFSFNSELTDSFQDMQLDFQINSYNENIYQNENSIPSSNKSQKKQQKKQQQSIQQLYCYYDISEVSNNDLNLQQNNIEKEEQKQEIETQDQQQKVELQQKNNNDNDDQLNNTKPKAKRGRPPKNKQKIKQEQQQQIKKQQIKQQNQQETHFNLFGWSQNDLNEINKNDNSENQNNNQENKQQTNIIDQKQSPQKNLRITRSNQNNQMIKIQLNQAEA
ncbi:hypothetical protein PPERSA_05594 [Pseudocohnilembus persalinus]|uniref:Zinc finger C3HC4 RING-type domain-containing protein n=1 Tax=Pseudocohnilembus persalinus TaxID=266149 RepID=A0A0V0Q7W6_PSEPJ|nr:hypothetical protein PPERSA_05594 [Pseudocohnilembus persalinus]|eukprot:KRW98250.1 hypothetical protein PPERSA_05594 [Pseudocohnilembus persalinus]